MIDWLADELIDWSMDELDNINLLLFVTTYFNGLTNRITLFSG